MVLVLVSGGMGALRCTADFFHTPLPVLEASRGPQCRSTLPRAVVVTLSSVPLLAHLRFSTVVVCKAALPSTPPFPSSVPRVFPGACPCTARRRRALAHPSSHTRSGALLPFARHLPAAARSRRATRLPTTHPASRAHVGWLACLRTTCPPAHAPTVTVCCGAESRVERGV